MDNRSKFNEIVSIFEKVRPSIERGITTMQSVDQQRAKQLWQELVEMVETKDDDIKTFADRLNRFNKQIYEYRNRSRLLASGMDMNGLLMQN